jgi:ceramide glucosyltransferase
MLLTTLGLGLTGLSVALMVWQIIAARRFPLHRRVADTSFTPPVTLLKPLKGADEETADCLRSWLTQDYPGPVQVLFGVASADDPVCGIVRRLLSEHPACDARLITCKEPLGANAKVSTLIQLLRETELEVVVVSDADVWAPPDLLRNVVAPLRDPAVGLVNCFYQLANAVTLAMRCEAVAVNADFWSQVLQAQSLKPLDFALGAVMALRRRDLEEVGGFAALADYLADDYQLGHRIAGCGKQIVLCPVVVECRSAPMTWRHVWTHQLRWARTIRACQPAPYFFSILNNVTLWPLLWWLARRLAPDHRALAVQLRNLHDPGFVGGWTVRVSVDAALLVLGACLLLRILGALDLQRRLTTARVGLRASALAPVKDLLQAAVWALAFLGNRVVWRGESYRVSRGGRLVKD